MSALVEALKAVRPADLLDEARAVRRRANRANAADRAADLAFAHLLVTLAAELTRPRARTEGT